MENISTTTPVGGASAGPSTRGQLRAELGDIVLVRLDATILRPMLVTATATVDVAPPLAREPQLEFRINGTLFCEPEDHTTAAVRTLGQSGTDPARLIGRPDRLLPLCYGEYLKAGSEIGQWTKRPTNLPGRS